MLKKKFIFENEIGEKSDFQKILDLNKKKLHPSEVEFYNSKGEDFSNIIEVTNDGLKFTFDGLKEFLQFFFPEEYGDDYSDGEYDATTYEYMYSGNWDWSDDFWSTSYDDWNEGYIIDSFKSEHFEIVKNIARYTSPTTYKLMNVNKNGEYKFDDNKFITSFLSSIGLEDSITTLFVDASLSAVYNSVPKGIEDRYCNCLKEVGIENYSQTYCFWKYNLDWGSAILFFASFGTENDKLLDLLFDAIKKIKILHLPEYYELRYEFWDNVEFNKHWKSGLTKILEDKYDDILNDKDSDNKEYYEIIDKIAKIGGFDRWINTKNKKYSVRIKNVDHKTNQIKYDIKVYNQWETKSGKTDIQSLINLLYNESLFDPMKYRNN